MALFSNSLIAEALAVFAGDEERLNHSRLNEVAQTV
jgi:hypothetical protein